MSKNTFLEYYNDIISLDNILQNRVNRDNNIEKILLESSFKRTLTKEQLRNANRLIGLKHGANFSVPGAGKTTTILAVYTYFKERNIFNKLFVVAPRNAFISWEDEIKYCFPEDMPEVVRLTGGRNNIVELLRDNHDVLLITYHQLSNVTDIIVNYIRNNKIHLILDESHRIKKGIPGIHYMAVNQLSDGAVRRDILSGTPMPQSSMDLKSQFEFLWPGSDIITKILTRFSEDERTRLLNEKIKPLYVRTTKSELGLRAPNIINTHIELGKIQGELYKLMKSETVRQLAGMDWNDRLTFRVLGKHVIRLIQVASNPMLISASEEYYDDVQPLPSDIKMWELLSDFAKYEKAVKIEYTIKKVKEITQREKVVVWTSFIKNIEMLESKLNQLGAVSIYGKIPTGDEKESDTREGRIRRFHDDPKCKVLIANPAACGEGISLHKVCHYAIYLDRTFNAAHFLQSVDRIHRLGLPEDVITNVEIISANQTIDAIINTRLIDKIEGMGIVLNDPDLHAFAYDPEDIIEEIPGGLDIQDIDELKDHFLGDD